MRSRIVLNKQDKTIKIVNRNNNIRLTHSGRVGPTGPVGPAGTITIGDTTTLAPGSDATVVNTGTPTAAVLDFGIPEGIQGIQGETPLAIQPEPPVHEDWLWVDTDDDSNDVHAEINRLENELNMHGDNQNNPHNVSKDQVGLANVDNTSDANKPISNATQTALANKADLVGGKVPESQLPSFVDDVLVFANIGAFPTTGENGKIYIAENTNLTYRWTGSAYVEISASLALGETSSTAYRGDRGKAAYDHSLRTDNPHSTTKAQVGLGNVDDTSDLSKPISTATQSALDLKATKLNLSQYQVPIRTLSGTGEPNNGFIATENATNNTIVYRNSSTGLFDAKTPVNDANVATKLYVDTAVSGVPVGNYVLKSGDTMTGRLFLDPTSTATSGAIRLEQFNNNQAEGIRVINMAVTAGLNMYWSDNSTFRIFSDQSLVLGGVSGVGFNTIPTHSLTVPSTATGIAYYNTSDQTTNLERVRHFWSSNVYNIVSEQSGTGAARGIRIGTFGGTIGFDVNSATPNGIINVFGTTGVGNSIGLRVGHTTTATTGLSVGLAVVPTINGSSTMGYTSFLVNPTETSTGSGVKLLADFQTGGTSQLSISNTGVVAATNQIQSTSPDILAMRHTRAGVVWAWGTAGTGEFYVHNPTNNRAPIQVATSALDSAIYIASGGVGFGSTPTHTITLPSTATGIAAFNTVDRTTNFERNLKFWSSNTYFDTISIGGTGSYRNMRWGTFASVGTRYLNSNSTGSNGFIQVVSNNLTGGESSFRVDGTAIGSSSDHYASRIQFTSNTSGTAGYVAQLINVTETSTGSGQKTLIDAQVGGVSKFKVDSNGNISANALPNSNVSKINVSSSAPASPTLNDIWIAI